MSESIMQTEKCCYFCGRKTALERHHVMAGVANRPIAERYGIWCWLCHDDHVGVDGAQYDKQKNWDLKKQAQMAFEEKHSHELWMKLFGRNYIY